MCIICVCMCVYIFIYVYIHAHTHIPEQKAHVGNKHHDTKEIGVRQFVQGHILVTAKQEFEPRTF